MATLKGTAASQGALNINLWGQSLISSAPVFIDGTTIVIGYGTTVTSSSGVGGISYASTTATATWSAGDSLSNGGSGGAVAGTARFFAFFDATTTGGGAKVYTALPPTGLSTETIWSTNPDTSTAGAMDLPVPCNWNGTPLIFYRGANRSSMGSSFGQMAYRTRTGVNTWSAETIISDTAGPSYTGPAIAHAVGARILFGFGAANDSAIYFRFKNNAGTLSTVTDTTVNVVSAMCKGVVTTGSTVNFLYYLSPSIAHYTYDGTSDTPTFTQVDTFTPASSAQSVALSADSNGTLYVLWRQTTNPGVYMVSKPTGGSWSSPYQLYSGSVMDNSQAVFYNNGTDNVLGFAAVIDTGSGSALRWYEEVLASAPSTPTTAPTVVAGVEKVTVTTPALASSTSATAFSIYRDGTLVTTGVGGSTAYDDVGASVLATQTYTVRGTNASGTSADSPASSSVVATPGVAVTALSSPATNTVQVDITRRPYAAVYRVYKSIDGGTSYALAHTSTSQVASGTYTWSDTAVEDFASYGYYVVVQVATPTQRDGANGTAASIVPQLWTSDTALPAARINPIAFPVAGGFYMGQGANGSGTLTTAYWYDTASNGWTAKTAITGLTQTFAPESTVTLANGVTYQLPISRANADVYWYNEASDTWTLHAVPFFDTTTPAKAYVYTAIGNTIYAHGSDVGTFKKWTPGVDSAWTTLTPLPASPTNSLYGHMARTICASDDGYIYAITVYGYASFRDGTARYNPGTDTWTHLGINTPWNSGGSYRGQSPSINYMKNIFLMHSAPDLTGTIPLDKTYLWMFDVDQQKWSMYDGNGPGTTSSSTYVTGIATVLSETATSSPAIYWLGGRVGVGSTYLADNRRAARQKKVRYYGVGTLTAESVVGGSFAGAGAGTLSFASGLITVSGTVATAGAGQLSLAAIVGVAGSCALTGVGTITGTAATLLLPPANLTATPVSPTQINLAWDTATGATGYDIERDSTTIVNNHPSTSYSDTGLTQGNAYSYRVRSVKIEAG